MVDGIPLVLADLDTWLAEESASLLRRDDLPPAVLGRIAQGAGGVLWRDLERRGILLASPDGPLWQWVRETLAQTDGQILELGCGTGRHGDHRVLGLDLHWDSLRFHPGPRLLADALDPPLAAGSFDAVLAINLLDSCRDPGLMLQQALALLAPGGRLVLSSPLHWKREVTPPPLWLSAEFITAWLRGQGFDVSEGEQSWTLQVGPNSQTIHRCHTWLAQTRSAPPSR